MPDPCLARPRLRSPLCRGRCRHRPPAARRRAGSRPSGSAGSTRRATRLIEAIRARSGGFGGVEEMLREYALSTKEGLALMVLAEALLRVPDAATADRLIEDKLGQGDFAGHEAKSDAFLVSASAWALGITARIIQPGETPEGSSASSPSASACRRCAPRPGRPCGSWATISCSGRRSRRPSSAPRPATGRLYRYSFDMLGEGARTAEDARRYFDSYAAAIEAIGRSAGNEPLPNRPGISVKLSALHPRYEALSRERVMARARAARRRARPEGAVLRPQLHGRRRGGRPARTLARRDRRRRWPTSRSPGWDGFGLAVQGYQKRAGAAIDHRRGPRRAARPAPDGAPRQGRLLGHRGEARAGARPRRLSGLHPQGDDRPQLRRLRGAAPGPAARASTRNSPPTTRSRSPRSSSARAASTATSSSACTAWARRSTAA